MMGPHMALALADLSDRGQGEAVALVLRAYAADLDTSGQRAPVHAAPPEAPVAATEAARPATGKAARQARWREGKRLQGVSSVDAQASTGGVYRASTGRLHETSTSVYQASTGDGSRAGSLLSQSSDRSSQSKEITEKKEGENAREARTPQASTERLQEASTERLQGASTGDAPTASSGAIQLVRDTVSAVALELDWAEPPELPHSQLKQLADRVTRHVRRTGKPWPQAAREFAEAGLSLAKARECPPGLALLECEPGKTYEPRAKAPVGGPRRTSKQARAEAQAALIAQDFVSMKRLNAEADELRDAEERAARGGYRARA